MASSLLLKNILKKFPPLFEHRKISYFLHFSYDNEIILWNSCTVLVKFCIHKGSKIFLWYSFLFVGLRIFFSDKYCQEFFLTCQVLVHVHLFSFISFRNLTLSRQKMLQDESPNVTRYLLLAKTANLPQEHGQYKVFIYFCYVSKIKYIFVSGVQWWKLYTLNC